MQLADVSSCFVSDEVFDDLYPIYIRNLSAIHWTPLQVAETAARFLAPDERAHVLDIGAGAGKFCIAGAYHTPGSFTGIEQRRNFVTIGNKVIRELQLERVSLLHGNFMSLDLKQFTGIYFYNSFHENIVHSDSLDNKIELSSELFDEYSVHFYEQLSAMPVGTRLATYWLAITEVPSSYKICDILFDGKLKLWMKEH